VRRAIGRFGQVLVLAGAVAIVGWLGSTSDTADARERPAFLRLPAVRVAAAPAPQRVDSLPIRALLDAARGANVAMCELAAVTLDGRSGWSSGHDGAFRPGGSDNPLASDITTWIHHREIDASSVPVLRAALADSDWCVRRLAAPLLGRIRGAAAVQAMLGALAASEATTREMGALALGFAEDSQATNALVARLRDDAPRVRATAAWALGEMERRETVRPLVAALSDADALVRESVARALGEIEDTAAIAPLTDLLKSDRDAAVRRAAAWALGEIAG
jgi:hypothetical protein